MELHHTVKKRVSKIIKREKAFNALLQNAWFCFEHDDFRNLAMVSKSIRKSVLDSVEKRKYEFGESIKKQETYNNVIFTTWNKYGSVCCIGGTRWQGEMLFLCRHVLDGNKRVDFKKVTWSNFLHSVALKPSPFTVTEAGSIRLYACSKEYIFAQPIRGYNRPNSNQHIFEYMLFSNGATTKKKCYISLGISRDHEMLNIINCPLLLNGFLKSSKVTEEKFSGEVVKLFHLCGVVLPKEFVQEQDTFGFYSLPFDIKKLVVSHFVNQCRNNSELKTDE
jgi:hypothetical protein